MTTPPEPRLEHVVGELCRVLHPPGTDLDPHTVLEALGFLLGRYAWVWGDCEDALSLATRVAREAHALYAAGTFPGGKP